MRKCNPTPTEQYFIEVAKGNTDLDAFEAAGLAYIKEKKVRFDNPADTYFQQLNSAKSMPKGAIPLINPYQLVDMYHSQALSYVNERYSDLCKPSVSYTI